MPCSASSRAVPPVEMISTPSSPSPRANSTRPRLSDTLRSARRIRTSPAPAASTAGRSASAIVLHADEPRVRRVERDAPGGDQAHRTRQQPVLYVVEELTSRRDVPMVRKVEGFLQEDRAAVHALVHEVDRHAGDLYAVLDGLLDRAEAREGGQERRVDVHDPPGEAADEGRREELHEPGQDDQLDAPLLEPVRERLVAPRAVGLLGQREDRGLDMRLLGPFEPTRLRAARHNAYDLDPVAPVDALEQRLEIRALPRDQDCDPKAHAATRSTGYGPSVVSSRPSSMSVSTRARMSARRMCDDTPYAGRPSYELRWIFLLREPWRISAQVVRPTAGRATLATWMIASSRPPISTGSGGGALSARAGSHTSQHPGAPPTGEP